MCVYAPLPETSSSRWCGSAPPEQRLLVEPGLRRHVGLDADDRLDAGGLGLLVEVVRAEHVAVVGHRDRRHAEPTASANSGFSCAAPSSIEYSVCTWRCTNELADTHDPLPAAADPPSGHASDRIGVRHPGGAANRPCRRDPSPSSAGHTAARYYIAVSRNSAAERREHHGGGLKPGLPGRRLQSAVLDRGAASSAGS